MKPQKFNEAYLRKVARRIREIYCDETVIIAVLLDSSDDREFDDLTPPPLYPPATRALYYLDRTTGEEKLQFYSNEKVTGEIRISN